MAGQHDIFLLMKIISDRVGALFASQVELPLTSAQCRVMAYLKTREGESVAQKDIERHLGVTHSTAKGLLQRLEEKGFVRTAFDSEDRRIKHVYPTEKSMQLREEVCPLIQEFEAKLLADLTEEERVKTSMLLHKIYDKVAK